MVAQSTQARVDALRQKLATSANRADAMYAEMTKLPDRESSLGFSFANSIHNDNAATLAPANKQKLQAILDSLSEKKTAVALPEPQLADTGAMSPSPAGLPAPSAFRAKLTQLT